MHEENVIGENEEIVIGENKENVIRGGKPLCKATQE